MKALIMSIMSFSSLFKAILVSFIVNDACKLYLINWRALSRIRLLRSESIQLFVAVGDSHRDEFFPRMKV
jgi:hypothetical protein